MQCFLVTNQKFKNVGLKTFQWSFENILVCVSTQHGFVLIVFFEGNLQPKLLAVGYMQLATFLRKSSFLLVIGGLDVCCLARNEIRNIFL